MSATIRKPSEPENIPIIHGSTLDDYNTHLLNGNNTLYTINDATMKKLKSDTMEELKNINNEIEFIYKFLELCDKQLKTIEYNKGVPIDQLLNILIRDIETFNYNEKIYFSNQLKMFRDPTRDKIITHIKDSIKKSIKILLSYIRGNYEFSLLLGTPVEKSIETLLLNIRTHHTFSLLLDKPVKDDIEILLLNITQHNESLLPQPEASQEALPAESKGGRRKRSTRKRSTRKRSTRKRSARKRSKRSTRK